MQNLLLLSDDLDIEGSDDFNLYCIHSDQRLRLTHEFGYRKSDIEKFYEGTWSREDFEAITDFEKKKYEELIPILSSRLNKIHNMEKEDLFWECIFGYSLLIHISNIKRVYDHLEFLTKQPLLLSKSAETIKNLNFIPQNQQEFRGFYEHSLNGTEQLINLYFSLFQNRLSGYRYFEQKKLTSERLQILSGKSFQNKEKFLAKLYVNRKLLLKQLVVYLVSLFKHPRFLIINALWTRQSIQSMFLKSKGSAKVDFYQYIPKINDEAPNNVSREILAEIPNGSNNFDKFFFSSLKNAAPKSLIENFKTRKEHANNFLNKYRKIDSLIVEGQDEDTLLLVALSKSKNIKTIMIEHNWLQHHLLGNQIWYYLRKVDKFFSLGWIDKSQDKIYPWGSLFPWSRFPESGLVKDIDILYISTCPHSRMAFSTGGDGDKGSYNAKTYTDMKSVFFNNLSYETCKSIYFKAYPEWRKAKLSPHYQDNIFQEEYSDKFRTYDSIGDIDTKDLINRSKLIIVDYLATAYLQALASNIPTIVLYNRKGYELTNEHAHIYDELFEAKVFHEDPITAAKFIEKIKDKPEAWWRNQEVRDAVSNFSRNFLSKSADLESDLLNMIKKNQYES